MHKIAHQTLGNFWIDRPLEEEVRQIKMNGVDAGNVVSGGKDIGLKAMLLFGLFNTLPFPLSILFDIFANTLGALSEVIPLGFQWPPMFGFLDGILRSKVIDLLASPVARLVDFPDRIPYFGPESPVMLLWFAMTLLASLLGAYCWTKWTPAPSYERLRRWSHLWFRWFLASMMLRYGAMKLYDTQFGGPIAQQLLTPAGELSRMQLLWMVFSASPTFELVAGAVEITAALLLLHQRTVFAGLALMLGILTQVVILNWLCGINVKFVSAFLFLVNLALLLPYWPRIREFLCGETTLPDLALSILDHAKQPKRLQRFGWIVAVTYLAAFHLTALRQRLSTQENFPRLWAHGAWEVQEVTKNEVALAKADLEHWHTLSFDLYHRFFVNTRAGEKSGWIYGYDPESGALKLQRMGQDKAPAWQDFSLRKLPTRQDSLGDAPETIELVGSIGPDRYRVRATRLSFRLLGEM